MSNIKAKAEVKAEPTISAPKVIAEVVMPETKKVVHVSPKNMDGFKSIPVSHIPRQYTSKGYEALIEAYKKQNPVKYEQKKSALAERLRRLK